MRLAGKSHWRLCIRCSLARTAVKHCKKTEVQLVLASEIMEGTAALEDRCLNILSLPKTHMMHCVIPVCRYVVKCSSTEHSLIYLETRPPVIWTGNFKYGRGKFFEDGVQPVTVSQGPVLAVCMTGVAALALEYNVFCIPQKQIFPIL